MPTYKRPDVYIRETLTQANPNFFPASSPAAFVGYCRRGPIGPTIIDTWPAYVGQFGDFVGGSDDDLHYAMYNYFANGGRQAQVVRTLGAGVATATRTLNDRAATPAAALIVNADNPGAWGNRVYVEILDTLTVGVFSLIVYYAETATATPVLRERFVNLSMDPASDRNVLSVVNSSLSGSNFINVSLPPNWTYVAATGTPAASVTPGGTALAGGADATAKPTVGAAGQVMAGVKLLDQVQDGFLLNMVSVTDVATLNAGIAYVEGRGDSMLFIDPAPGRTAAQIVSDAGMLTRSSYAAIYWPQVLTSDPSNISPGTTKQMSPVPGVLGQVALTDASRGTQKAPAGWANALRGVLGLETPMPGLSDWDTAAAGQVNTIRYFTGNGYLIWGSKTLKQGQADSEISIRRTLMALEAAILQVTRFAVFEPNDELLWGELYSACDGVLRNLWQSGGLRGANQSQAYYVVCDDTNNTSATIAAGEVHVEIGCALQYPAQFIVINIGQFEGGAQVSVTGI